MNRQQFKEMVRDISRLTRIPKVFIYAYFITAIASILISLTTLLGLIPLKSNAAKPDSCLKYAEMGKIYLEGAKSLLPPPEQKSVSRGAQSDIDASSSLSAAYSSYYLVCRDLERQDR